MIEPVKLNGINISNYAMLMDEGFATFKYHECELVEACPNFLQLFQLDNLQSSWINKILPAERADFLQKLSLTVSGVIQTCDLKITVRSNESIAAIVKFQCEEVAGELHVRAVFKRKVEIAEQETEHSKTPFSANSYKYFFLYNPIPMWIYDVETLSFVEVNKAAIHNYGFTHSEFLSMTIADIRPKEDVDALEKDIAKNINWFADSGYWKHKAKNGATIWAKIFSFAITYYGKKAKMVIAIDSTKKIESDIELSRLNQKLQEYKDAVTNASIAYTTNCDWLIEEVNENFVQTFEFKPEELIGNSMYLLSSGVHDEQFFCLMRRELEMGNIWKGDICLKSKSGKIYWVNSCKIPLKDSIGKVVKVLSISNDITENKQKQQEIELLNAKLIKTNIELKKSQAELENLSLVAKYTSNQVIITNNTGHIAWANEAFEQATGYLLAEIKGKRPSSFLHGALTDKKETTRISNLVRNGEPIKSQVLNYKKNGETYWAFINAAPIRNAHNEVIKYVTVVSDISEQKQREAELANSEAKLNAFFSTTHNLHVLFDANFKITSFNKVAQDFVKQHFRKELKIGDKGLKMLPSSQVADFLINAKKALAGTAVYNREVQVVYPGKRPTWWSLNYFPAYDKCGNIVGIAFSAVDIDERKKFEQKLLHQNMVLKKIAWMQSHEVRRPLANILGLSQLLLDNTNESPKELVTKICTEANELDKMVKKIVLASASIQVTSAE